MMKFLCGVYAAGCAALLGWACTTAPHSTGGDPVNVTFIVIGLAFIFFSGIAAVLGGIGAYD